MEILFDSTHSCYKMPFGCVEYGKKVFIKIKVPRRMAAQKVFFILQKDSEPEKKIPLYFWKMRCGYDVYKNSFYLPEVGLYFFHFSIETRQRIYFVYRKDRIASLQDNGESWQISCYIPRKLLSENFWGKTIYQIFPDRFYYETLCQSEGKLTPFTIQTDTDKVPSYAPNAEGKILNQEFFGGNLQGIQKKIPYLKSLGVEMLYLNPIFFAYSNHRYDTADYRRVDPLLGTNQDFESLCETVHQNGMKLILDGVFSHTGSRSIYFDKENEFSCGAYHHADSPYVSWYQFESYPQKYVSWWGINTLPCVCELRKSYLEFIIEGENSILSYWLSMGADGFRLDVADELPDEFIQKFKRKMRKIKPDSILIGEVWEDASHKMSYGKRRTYLVEDELDGVMNYPYREAMIKVVLGSMTGQRFCEEILRLAENYPPFILQSSMVSLSTHDTPRILTVLSLADFSMSKDEKALFRLTTEEKQKAEIRQMAAVFLQFFLPGCPTIYYGDEIGMEGFEDPLNRCFFSWDRVKSEKNLLKFYGDMAALRKEYSLLKTGHVFLESCGQVLYISRYQRGKKLIAVLNLEKDMYQTKKRPSLIYSHRCIIKEDAIGIKPFGFYIYRE